MLTRPRHLGVLVVQALALALALIPEIASSSEGPGKPLTITDQMGRQVTVTVPARRVVLLEAYELLPVLGTWDQVAGLSRFAFDNDLLAAVRPDLRQRFSDAGSAFSANVESLLRLRPDLVLTWSSNPDAVKFLAAKGLTVVAVYPESLNELYETMRLVGRLMGAEKRAESAIRRMEETFALVRARVAGVPSNGRKKALWLLGKPTTVGGGRGVMQDVLTLAGLVNGAAAVPQRSLQVSGEQFAVWRPDVIFVWGSAGYAARDVLDAPQWRFVPAVRDRKVFKAPKWSIWSPRLAPVALWMAARAYPERFSDLNVEQVIDRFYRDVYGIRYSQVTRIVD